MQGSLISAAFPLAGAGATQYYLDGAFKPMVLVGAAAGSVAGSLLGVTLSGALVLEQGKDGSNVGGGEVMLMVALMVGGAALGTVAGVHFLGAESWTQSLKIGAGALAGGVVGGYVMQNMSK